MKIGLQIPSFTWPGGPAEVAPRLKEIAQTAEHAGFASIWVMDHLFQIDMVGEVDEPMLESYSTLAYLAGVTQNAQLGTMVTGFIYRYPGMLAKTVSTLDVLSAGRAYLGIGAAWFEREAEGLGLPFPPLSERYERLEETLQIVNQMWSDDDGAYTGEYYQLQETLNSPQPLAHPHPAILIGGMGEQKTLRLVAQYADACNLFMYAGTDVLQHKLTVLKQHCQDVGRDYDEIEKTTLGTVHLADGEMTPDDVVSTCRQLADIGVKHAIFNMPNVHEISPLQTFGEVIIPAVSDF